MSNSEEIVMNVFWQTPEPLTVSQLSRLLVGQDWSKNYIHKVLRWLSDKEFIKVVGIAQEGRYQAQQYVPTLTKDEYLAYMLEEQGVNNSLFAHIAVTLFKKDRKQRTPEQDEKLIAELEKMVAHWKEVLPKAEIIPISALSNFNIDYVKHRVEDLMPESPPYFEKDALTDKPARFFVTEIIREKILLYYQKEIPYAVEVVVELFKEEEEMIHIKALIIVERDSQKGIIIGHKGQALKKVGAMARKDIERFFEKKVFLEMFVKVEKDWRNRDNLLKNFGYQLD